MNPSTKLSPDFRPNTLIDNKSFKEIVNNFKDDIERTLENCQLLYIESAKFAVSFSKEAAGYNLIKNIREMWDYEILIDACIDALPLGKQTDQMKSWVPYPLTDKGASYMAYKKERFNSPDNLGANVSDEMVLELFSHSSGDNASNEHIQPIQDTPATNYTRNDYIDLLKRYEQGDYVPSDMDKAIESSSSFRIYSGEYIKQKNYDKALPSVCAEIKKQFQMEYDKAMTILNPPSQFFAEKLANMILHQFNQPNRKYYKKDFKLTLKTNKGKKTFILENKA